MIKIVTVGAGISGLVAARTLADAGESVTLLDKGRAPGGRLASRRIRFEEKTGTFDYGAQSFTIQSSDFDHMAQKWIDSDVIDIWSDGFYDGTGVLKRTNHSRYKGVHSMRSIADHLGEHLTVVTQCRIKDILRDGSRWLLVSDDQREFDADILLLTAPVPQSLELLKKWDINIDNTVIENLEAVRYNPTFTVMALLENESAVPEPGGLWLNGDPVAWIGDNSKKGISPHAFAVTIHASEEYSLDNFERDREQVGQDILKAAAPHLGARVLKHQVHRWKFATPTVTFGAPYYANESVQLWMAGDSFGGVRLENAALSGYRAAQSMIEYINS